MAMKNIVITSIRGAGLQLAKHFLQRGDRVFLGWHEEHSQRFIHQSLSGFDTRLLIMHKVDFSSFKGSSRFLEAIRSKMQTVDVLINNAGVFWNKGITANGYDFSYGINYLGTAFMCLNGIDMFTHSRTVVVNFAPVFHKEMSLEVDFEFLKQHCGAFNLEYKYFFSDVVKSNIMVGVAIHLLTHKLQCFACTYGIDLQCIVADTYCNTTEKSRLSLVERIAYQSFFSKENNALSIADAVDASLQNEKNSPLKAQSVTTLDHDLRYQAEQHTEAVLSTLWQETLLQLSLTESQVLKSLT